MPSFRKIFVFNKPTLVFFFFFFFFNFRGEARQKYRRVFPFFVQEQKRHITQAKKRNTVNRVSFAAQKVRLFLKAPDTPFFEK